MTGAGLMPWAALAVGDGVQSDTDGAWHEVTRVESGWIELDGERAFPVPAGECWGWGRALAQAAAVVSAHLGGVEVERAE
jgi:hypothetical protein